MSGREDVKVGALVRALKGPASELAEIATVYSHTIDPDLAAPPVLRMGILGLAYAASVAEIARRLPDAVAQQLIDEACRTVRDTVEDMIAQQQRSGATVQ